MLGATGRTDRGEHDGPWIKTGRRQLLGRNALLMPAFFDFLDDFGDES